MSKPTSGRRASSPKRPKLTKAEINQMVAVCANQLTELGYTSFGLVSGGRCDAAWAKLNSSQRHRMLAAWWKQSRDLFIRLANKERLNTSLPTGKAK